jgi:hypothetical protein
MKASNFKEIVFGTVCGLVSAGAGLTTLGNNGLIAGLPGFANAIHSALKVENPEKMFDPSGMKYLALLEKKLG